MTNKIYEKISFKRISLDNIKNIYYVYYDINSAPIKIEAENVLDAVEKSNVEKPIKVQRINNIIKQKTVISKNYLINSN